ncbi:MAG: tetratricopeptide repeat protein [Thermoplasmata archaeon]|nr:tetratricopeptide repeat protein [Thermoplasmata archaeon]
MNSLEKGEDAYSKGRFQEALGLARKGDRGKRALSLEGRSLLRLGKHKEAVNAFRQAVEHGGGLGAWTNLITALSAGRGYEEAYKATEEAEEAVGMSSQLLLSRARVLRSWKKHALALAVCRSYVSSYPFSTEGWELYLSLCEQMADAKEAGVAAKALLDIDNKNRRALKAVAETSLERGRSSEARASARTLVEMEPDKPMGWMLLSETAREMGKRKRALAYADRALLLNEKFPRAWLHKALLLAEEKKEKEAKHAFRMGMKLNKKMAREKCVLYPVLAPFMGR